MSCDSPSLTEDGKGELSNAKNIQIAEKKSGYAGVVNEKSDGDGLEPIVFLGSSEARAERRSLDHLSRALIQMRDWWASVGRGTNSDRNHGRETGGETWSPGGAAAS